MAGWDGAMMRADSGKPDAAFEVDIPAEMSEAMNAGGVLAPRVSRSLALQVPAVQAASPVVPEPGALITALMEVTPSWQDRQAMDTEPTGAVLPSRLDVPRLSYVVNVAGAGSVRFHRGTAALVSAPWGVWQNTQISAVPLNLFSPEPVEPRLCFVPAICACAGRLVTTPAVAKASAIARVPRPFPLVAFATHCFQPISIS